MAAFIDTQAEPRAWADALAAPCSFRTIADFQPDGSHQQAGAAAPSTVAAPTSPRRAYALRGLLAGVLLRILSRVGRPGFFSNPIAHGERNG